MPDRGLLRRHPWAVLWTAAAVTAGASVGRDLAGAGAPGIATGWETVWLGVMVVAGVVCLAAVIRLARIGRAPHVPRHRLGRHAPSDAGPRAGGV